MPLTWNSVSRRDKKTASSTDICSLTTAIGKMKDLIPSIAACKPIKHNDVKVHFLITYNPFSFSIVNKLSCFEEYKLYKTL